jgi:hypothetical protein
MHDKPCISVPVTVSVNQMRELSIRGTSATPHYPNIKLPVGENI